MEPIFEPDDVDLVISGGRWSAEVVAEVAEFFRHCDDDDVPSLAVSDSNSKNRKSAAAAEVIRPVVPGT